MMILGTVRLICALGDYATSYLEVARGSFSLRVLGRFLQDNPPAVVLGFAWPLALGIILQRTGRVMFLRAAAITFLVMSAGGIVALLAGLTLRSDWQGFFGSFPVSRGMLNTLRPASMAKVIIGSVQLLLELGTAAWAWMLSRQARGLEDSRQATPSSWRTRLHGRLALYLSLAFLVLNIRLPFWSAYLEVLNRSQFIRELILENDTRHHVSYRSMFADSPAGRRAQELEMLLSSATRHVTSREYAEAKAEYLELIERLQSNEFEAATADWREDQLARASNNLAWLLVTCADESFRDPGQALPHANRAVELAPEEGTYWNTLGVARFRSGQLDQALKAFDRSMELRGTGDSFDWYFEAMVHAEQGRMDKARKWYDMAVIWNENREPGDEELRRFRVEAAKVLGLPEPPPLARGPEFIERKSGLHPVNKRSRFRNLAGPDATAPRKTAN